MIKLRKRIQNQNDKNLSFTENKKKEIHKEGCHIKSKRKMFRLHFLTFLGISLFIYHISNFSYLYRYSFFNVLIILI